MIVERHYDDESLIGILHGEGSEALDPHLTACSTCAETLQSYRAVADVLGQEAVWDSRELRQEPSAETISRLRAFASARQAEVGIAEELVESLFREPRESWCSIVAHDIRYQNAGVANLLISSSESALTSQPKDGLEIGRAALVVAQSLDESDYETNVVARVRGAAGRQYAYALFIVGNTAEALKQVERAQRELDRCAAADYDMARLNIVRALVYRSIEKFQEAITLSRDAARVFDAYGDRQRLSSARIAEAYLLMQLSRYRDALAILRTIATGCTSDVDGFTRALTISNIALCQAELGETVEALSAYQLAELLFDEMGAAPNAARNRANIAVLLRKEGHVVEAKRRFQALAAEARELGMSYFAVTIDLELADVMLAERNFAEAERLCGNVVEYFQRSGSGETECPLIALTYLREAAEQRKLSRELVRHVKRYVENAEKQPSLLFVPPPHPVDLR
ncbi:MAG TPA: hypothetical protein VMS98_20740 [Thermoanaerobaculia bacterium]|nr:hypothetical protein [Thermoanaerobaculia bacterium]